MVYGAILEVIEKQDPPQVVKKEADGRTLYAETRPSALYLLLREAMLDAYRQQVELEEAAVEYGLGNLLAGQNVVRAPVEIVFKRPTDEPLPGGPLRFERRQFDRELVDLLVEVVPRLEPMIAGVGVHPEIANQQRRPDIEAERGQE